MNRILITGATGFVGSSLAAGFLARGARVIALSRNDADGMRTVNATTAAARGCALDISGALKGCLDVIDVDFSSLDEELAEADLSGVTEVWHVAAEMSYSPHKLSQSFSTNVGNTVRLYEAVRRHAPSCRRFYYVSTAYVAGMAGGPVIEELHAGGRMLNTYQVAKWSAEQALHLMHQRRGLPVTLYRPSIVVGHRKTGWAHRNGFGFYMFLDAMLAIAKAGHKQIAVDLKPQVRPDLISIDQLVADACALTWRAQPGREFEVFHCTGGQSVRMDEIVRLWGEAAGVRSDIGAPSTTLEQRFDRAVEPNRPFAQTEWQFERSRLDAAIGRKSPPAPLAIDDLRGLCRWYASDDGVEAAVAVSEAS